MPPISAGTVSQLVRSETGNEGRPASPTRSGDLIGAELVDGTDERSAGPPGRRAGSRRPNTSPEKTHTEAFHIRAKAHGSRDRGRLHAVGVHKRELRRAPLRPPAFAPGRGPSSWFDPSPFRASLFLYHQGLMQI